MIHMEDAIDTEGHGFLPAGHVDSAANAYQRPIPWYGHVGLGTIEIIGNPEGVVGKATLASADKARPGLEALLDYMVTLHDDIMEKFPVGKLPDANLVTQRFTQEQVDELIKGPLHGGKHLYTVAWPPT
jgi:creatinine amidohydrolase